jgi:hypothetical protein
MTSLANPFTGLARVAISGLTSVTPKLDSLVNEVIRSFSLNTLILLNDVITVKLVYRLTIEHTYTYYSRPRSPRLGLVGPSVVLSRSSVFIGGISGALTA